MAEVKRMENELESSLAALQKELENYSRQENSQKSKLLRKCEEICRTISLSIDSLEAEVLVLDRAQKAQYTQILKAHKNLFDKLKNDCESKRNEFSNTKSLFAEKPAQKELKDMNSNEAMTYGNHLQDKQDAAADGILIQIDEADRIATAINQKLYAQTETLQKVHDNAMGLQATQQRNERTLRYFEKQKCCCTIF